MGLTLDEIFYCLKQMVNLKCSKKPFYPNLKARSWLNQIQTKIGIFKLKFHVMAHKMVPGNENKLNAIVNPIIYGEYEDPQNWWVGGVK